MPHESPTTQSFSAEHALKKNKGVLYREREHAMRFLETRCSVRLSELEGMMIVDSVNNQIELTKRDREKMQTIAHYFDGEKSDTDFRIGLATMIHEVPEIWAQLEFAKTTNVHMEISALNHTFNVMRMLDTQAYTSEEREVLRISAFLHDIGKVIDGQDANHPRYSLLFVHSALDALGIYGEKAEKIEKLVTYHDVLGDLARNAVTHGHGLYEPEEVLQLFNDVRDVEILTALSFADLQTIPGLRKFAMNIKATGEHYKNFLRAKESFIYVKREPAPQSQKSEQLRINQLLEKLQRVNTFDSVNIYEEMAQSRETFDGLEVEDKLLLVDELVRCAKDQDKMMFTLLQIMGRETDRGFVSQLEEGRNVRLDSLRIAVELCTLMYNAWEMDDILRETFNIDSSGNEWYTDINDHDDSDQDAEYSKQNFESIDERLYIRMRKGLKELKKCAWFLSPFEIHATHVTKEKHMPSINDDGFLRATNGRSPIHYEGSGVYVGTFNSFRALPWEGADESPHTLWLRVPLACTFAHLVKYRDLESALNILADRVMIHNMDSNNQTIATGIPQWEQGKYNPEETTKWKLGLIKEALGCKAMIVPDEDGNNTVIVDTDEMPIVWATIARALRIYRMVPLEYLDDTDIPNKAEIYTDIYWSSNIL